MNMKDKILLVVVKFCLTHMSIYGIIYIHNWNDVLISGRINND